MTENGESLAGATELEGICSEIRRLLDTAVQRSLSCCQTAIMLSGGLDTSILAYTASRYAKLGAFTVALKGAPAPDVEYSSLMAGALGFPHRIHYLEEEDLQELIPYVVRTLRSFDPMEIRNSLVVYAGMRVAKEGGFEAVITGDGADELMAGYSFAFNLEKERLDQELQKLWSIMSFSSIPLAESLGITAKLPFLDHDFKRYAMALDSKYKVGREGGAVYGKWILRKAYEGLLPPEITWRTKTPIECGSGTTVLTRLYASRITDSEFSEKKSLYLDRDNVAIRDKEQLAYYEVYRSAIGIPCSYGSGRKCPQCNSAIPERATFCRTCGAYPI